MATSPSYSQFLRICVLTTFGLAAGIVALNWRVDPLQFYRRASYAPLIAHAKRYQNPGLARNYDYDTVIIGSSLSENVSAEDVRDTLGGKSLNLAMSGASMREQTMILEVALRTGHVSTVVWELNHEYMRGRPDWVSDYDGPFPFHFYDTNPLNEIQSYLLSLDTLKSSAKILLGRAGLIAWHPESLEDVQTWARKKKFGREAVKRVWDKLADGRQLIAMSGVMGEMTTENMNRSFDANVLDLARANPQVRFVLLFPPVSVLRHVLFEAAQPGTVHRMVENKRHVYSVVRDFPNIELFDFQALREIVTDFDHYCDTGHYDPGVNRLIFQSIAKRQHLARDEDPSEIERLVAERSPEQWAAMIGGKPLPARMRPDR